MLSRSLCSTCLRGRTAASSLIVSIGDSRDIANHSADSKLPSGRNTILKRRINADPPKSEEPTVKRSLLQETKLEEYLQHIASTSCQVTLADIERCRPLTSPAENDPGYEQEYNSLSETLVRSFTFTQLRRFLELYHLDAPAKRNKWQFAAAIIENAWKWPSLMRTKKTGKDWTEVVYRSFPLDIRQAFLLLGKDGADLLALSSDYNLHVSFSANPLSLRVEGSRGSIDDLSRHIDHFKDTIKEELFSLPNGLKLHSDTLQRISRLSGVFVEDTGHGIIRLSKKSAEDGADHSAKRLMLLAAFEAARELPTLLYGRNSRNSTPSSISDPRYSLYPFFPPRPLSRINGMGSLFRIRQVGEHAHSNSHHKPSEAGLAGDHRIFNLSGQQVVLRDVLRQTVETLDVTSHSTTTVTASFGYLLTCPALSQRSDITPPLQGCQGLAHILDWLPQQSGNRFFATGSPIQRFHLRPTDSRLVYRLVYHSLSTQTTGNAVKPMQILKFELALSLPEHLPGRRCFKTGPSFQDNVAVHTASDTNQEHGGLESTSWVGNMQEIDLMMPDYAMDIQFCVFNGSHLIEEKWPDDFRGYVNKLDFYLTSAAEDGKTQQPNPPLILKHHGLTYGLETCSIVRRTCGSSTEPSITTVSESLRDVGASQSSTSYQVICEEPSASSWSPFLIQCDAIMAAIRLKSSIPVERGCELNTSCQRHTAAT